MQLYFLKTASRVKQIPVVKKSSPPMMAKAKDQPRSNDGRKPGKNSGKSFFLVAQMIVPTMMKVAEEKESNKQKGKKWFGIRLKKKKRSLVLVLWFGSTLRYKKEYIFF